MKQLICGIILGIFIGCNGQPPTPEPPVEPPAPPPEPPAACATYYGADFFAHSSGRMDCDAILATFNEVRCPAFGVLTDTFGSDYGCLYRFIQQKEAQNKRYLLRIHLTNECCRRYHAPQCAVNCCVDGELFQGMTKEHYSSLLEREEGWVMDVLRDRMRWWQGWLGTHLGPNGEVIFSDGLESNFSAQAARSVDKVIREFGYEVAYNGMHGAGGMNEADYREYHSTPGIGHPRAIHALDGYDIKIDWETSCYPRQWSPDEVRAWARSNQGSKAILLWHAAGQGLAGCPQTWQYPRHRSFHYDRNSASVLNQILKDVSN